MSNKIKHLAIIMDGNARWAEKNGLSTSMGHKQGKKVLIDLLPHISSLNIPYITLYAFSSENWQRPIQEIQALLNLFYDYISSDKYKFEEYEIKVKVIGTPARAGKKIQDKINELVDFTKNNTKLTLCFAFSYGARREILDACNKIIDLKKNNISEEDFRNYLYDPEMPDVDLLIRTSGLYRVSNFLLWQIAYAELYFLDKYWPEITISDILDAIDNFSKRVRNYGAR